MGRDIATGWAGISQQGGPGYRDRVSPQGYAACQAFVEPVNWRAPELQKMVEQPVGSVVKVSLKAAFEAEMLSK